MFCKISDIQYLISNEFGRSDEWWFSVLFTVPFGPPYCCEGAWPPLRPFLL